MKKNPRPARSSRAQAAGVPFAALAAMFAAACGGSGERMHAGRLGEIPSSALSECTDAGLLQGVDVSQYDATVNWDEVRDAGVVFAIARVSDGLDFFDPDFDSNWSSIKSVGLVRGVYQYFEPDQDPHQQAALLLAHIPDFGPGDLPPVIDVETLDGLDAGPATAAVTAWVADIQGALQRRPIIYTSARVWNEFDEPPLAADLWVANWQVTCPAIPTAWSGAGWIFWQYSATGSVPGLTAEPADLDRFNGSLAALKLYAQGPVLDGGLDGGAPDGGASDAGPIDAGAADAGGPDAGAIDGGASDAGSRDGGILDGGAPDGGARDGGILDGGARDAGSLDGGVCPSGTVRDGGVCAPAAQADSGGCASAGASWLACAVLLLALGVRRKTTLRAPRKPC